MVLMKEFRIVMPLSVEEYQVAQMYAIMKMQQQSTTGTEGVEILENRPFEDGEFGKGQYSKKIYRLQSKAPSWLTAFAPADALIMQEEAWNAYPRCKSVVKCQYFTKFRLTIDTIHKADSGGSENALGLSKKQLAARQVDTIDISTAGTDYWSYLVGGNNTDFSKFQSARTGRGPLLEGWQDKCYPVMTAYKMVTVDAPYWGFGSRLEQALIAGERALFLELHRSCFTWIDEWIGLTLEDMRDLEKKSDYSLNKKLGFFYQQTMKSLITRRPASWLEKDALLLLNLNLLQSILKRISMKEVSQTTRILKIHQELEDKKKHGSNVFFSCHGLIFLVPSVFVFPRRNG